MRYSHPELLQHLASNYVLGTLTGGARRRFERLQRDRADLQALVAQWESRLGQLAVSIPGQQPSANVWTAISARTQPTAVPALSGKMGWPGWMKPAGLAFGGLAAGILAATAVFFTAPALFMSSDQVAMRSGEKLPQSYVGLLTDAQGNGKVLVSSLRHGKTMSIKVIGSFTPPATGKLVLWAVPANAPAFAIGTVPANGSTVSMLPDTSEKLLSKVSKLIVTLETEPAPVVPSATVVLAGNCAKLW